MQATSRESRNTVGETFDELVAGSDAATLHTLGSELSALTALLSREKYLRKHLSEASDSTEAKQGLAEQLLGGKIADTTMQVLRALVGQRWSRINDFVDATEFFGRQAVLAAAEREDLLEEVEDELFRFGRMLGGESRLNGLLSDETKDADGRVGLLDEVLGDKANDYTKALAEQAVRVSRRRSVDAVIDAIAQLAADRKGQAVAQVTAAVELSDAQRDRLAGVLSDIYRTTVSLQVEVDPEVLGGLLIRIGDEVIDGSVLSKLSRAAHGLPD